MISGTLLEASYPIILHRTAVFHCYKKYNIYLLPNGSVVGIRFSHVNFVFLSNSILFTCMTTFLLYHDEF